MSHAPMRVMLGLPCGDHKTDTEVQMSQTAVLAATGGSVQPYWLNGNSNVLQVRNLVAHYFLYNTQCDTLVFWDNDIVATLEDFRYLMEGEEQIVIAPYSRKEFGREPVGFGMGFCRIHRSVFEGLNAWTDEQGEEVLGRYYQTEVPPQSIATHFFYSGPSPEARWYGEDTGFWHFCARRGFTQRLERRTRLGHIGRCKYGYPDQIPANVVPSRGMQAYPPVGNSEGFDNTEEPDQAENFAGGEF
jgi:hypothetical protein